MHDRNDNSENSMCFIQSLCMFPFSCVTYTLQLKGTYYRYLFLTTKRCICILYILMGMFGVHPVVQLAVFQCIRIHTVCVDCIGLHLCIHSVRIWLWRRCLGVRTCLTNGPRHCTVRMLPIVSPAIQRQPATWENDILSDVSFSSVGFMENDFSAWPHTHTHTHTDTHIRTLGGAHSTPERIEAEC